MPEVELSAYYREESVARLNQQRSAPEAVDSPGRTNILPVPQRAIAAARVSARDWVRFDSAAKYIKSKHKQ